MERLLLFLFRWGIVFGMFWWAFGTADLSHRARAFVETALATIGQ